MSERILVLVALSVILAMVFGTGMRIRHPTAAPSLRTDLMLKSDPTRPLASVASIDAKGESKPLNERITRPTVITYWATWCIPCLRELPTFLGFKPMAEAAGVDLITISEDKEGVEHARKFLEEKGLTALPFLTDADGSVAKATRVKGLPTAIIVNGKGEEVARMEGEADWGTKETLDVVIELLGMGSAAPVAGR
ncbi:Thiol-disulfide isomeras and thioredoxin [Candidatus Terasakiella magnetica]|nr:Thiol-disulfide isomeras and thioredoxin [Candidatus Terasakiella magnetica]